MFQPENSITRQKLEKWANELGLELKTMQVGRSEVFLEQRQKCNYFYFVVKGFMRFYYIDIDGNERTHMFSSENSMFTSPVSFFNDEPNIFSFQALEASEFICLTRDQLSLFTSKIEEANKALEALYINYIVSFSRKVISIYTETAEYRYLKLIEDNPDVFQKAKLAHIASYLGITQQSLSRIRKQLIH